MTARHYTQPIQQIQRSDCETLLRLAFLEDAPYGDPTSEAIFPQDSQGRARIFPKEAGVVCGLAILPFMREIYQEITGYKVDLTTQKNDGDEFSIGETLLELSGSTRALLRLERPLLNFLQYLSGIATTTASIMGRANPEISILDTRKTLPGYRRLAKYAVYCGGGTNHRIDLSEMVMLKDNHIQEAGGIENAVKNVRSKFPNLPIEVEVDHLSQLPEALVSSPNFLLLDNMDLETTKKAVDLIRKHSANIRIELSGGIKPENLRDLSTLGEVGVSMGYLTHTTRFLDLSMEML